MRERFIFGGSTRNHSENLFKDKVGQRLESSQLSLLAGRVDSDPTVSLFLVMSTRKQNGSSTKYSNGATALASRQQALISLLQDYFYGIPASVIVRYLGDMVTGWVGSDNAIDPIQTSDTVFHATRTCALIVALQEALNQEGGANG